MCACSIAAMQASYNQQKVDDVAKYRKALADQVKFSNLNKARKSFKRTILE